MMRIINLPIVTNNNSAWLLVSILFCIFFSGSAFVPQQIHHYQHDLHHYHHYRHQHASITIISSQLHLFKTLDFVVRNKGKNPGSEVATEEDDDDHHDSSSSSSSSSSAVIKNNVANGKSLLNSKDSTAKIPFVIERLGARPGDHVFRDIAEMCIAVFFNDGKIGRASLPWKEVQLSYLRMIQMADLRRRRRRDTTTNAMFVAYKVEEAASNAALSKPLILNLREISNLRSLVTNGDDPNQKDFVRTDVLGFCEVSIVPFGLGKAIAPAQTINPPQLAKLTITIDSNGNFFDDESEVLKPRSMVTQGARTNYADRPVLTNLSVDMRARRSGVGSKLVEACERVVSREWGKSEMVLEVEDENKAALSWYQKRGYRVLFSDSTSKRYDVSGLVVKKVKCTRQVLRKAMNTGLPTIGNSGGSTLLPGNNSQNNSPFDSLSEISSTVWKRLTKQRIDG